MSHKYEQLNLKERKEIENGLYRGDSFRAIARLIGRSPSTISLEVRQNRIVRAYKAKKAKCRDRNWCKRIGLCERCAYPNAYCVGCDRIDCRDVCAVYAEQTRCDALTRAPWVCNACRRNRYGCSRQNRYIYDANAAHTTANERRSNSRRGIDMERERAEIVLATIKDAECRGLSPYEISVLYEKELGISRSTIYRWTDAGYGSLLNIDLERKVGFKPRRKNPKKRSSAHSKKRSYEAYSTLNPDLKESRTEMDTVVGTKHDDKAILTLYNVATHLQLCLLLEAKTQAEVKRACIALRSIMPCKMYESWMRCVLTDNGEEFGDEVGLGAVLGEANYLRKDQVRLFYCDPRQSQQKGSCEKNHSELRQILKKGYIRFDELTKGDMAILMSHVNSCPRHSLGGKTPIQMLRFIYGDREANDLLDALGIEEIDKNQLLLKPEILNIERERRGDAPLEFLK